VRPLEFPSNVPQGRPHEEVSVSTPHPGPGHKKVALLEVWPIGNSCSRSDMLFVLRTQYFSALCYSLWMA
jgi:hypothetical protein